MSTYDIECTLVNKADRSERKYRGRIDTSKSILQLRGMNVNHIISSHLINDNPKIFAFDNDNQSKVEINENDKSIHIKDNFKHEELDGYFEYINQ
ncbi:hypothetical protein ABK040_007246 [Willaertia magna]